MRGRKSDVFFAGDAAVGSEDAATARYGEESTRGGEGWDERAAAPSMAAQGPRRRRGWRCLRRCRRRGSRGRARGRYAEVRGCRSSEQMEGFRGVAVLEEKRAFEVDGAGERMATAAERRARRKGIQMSLDSLAYTPLLYRLKGLGVNRSVVVRRKGGGDEW